MAAKYKKNGEDLRNFIAGGNTSSNDNDSYNAFPGNITTETNVLARPLPFGYKIPQNGNDIANTRTAYFYDFVVSGNVSAYAPTGTTKIRAILIGGGGGGGQAGGGMDNRHFRPVTDKSGAGGGGGGSGYTIFMNDTIYSNNLYVTVGTGGPGGTTNNAERKGLGDKGYIADFNVTDVNTYYANERGGNAYSGNKSMITNNANSNTIAQALGGGGGLGGQHGLGNAFSNGGLGGTGDVSGNSGNIGSQLPTFGIGGNGGIAKGYNQNSYDLSGVTFGKGGAGGNSNQWGLLGNGNDGAQGSNGVVRVYYLTD